MKRPAAPLSAPRRFVLLPELAQPRPGAGPRIRRYRLASVGSGARRRRAPLHEDVALARMARELGRTGRA